MHEILQAINLKRCRIDNHSTFSDGQMNRLEENLARFTSVGNLTIEFGQKASVSKLISASLSYMDSPRFSHHEAVSSSRAAKAETVSKVAAVQTRDIHILLTE